MGLDMYLEKRTYVKNWDHMKAEEKHNITIKKGGKIRKDINSKRVKEITEEVCYWRKANAIHNWFVQNVQDGEDDCRDYYVAEEQLEMLSGLCKKVLKSLKGSKKKTIKVETGWDGKEKTFSDWDVFVNTDLAEKLLPSTGGFFFGGTEYDQDYIDDLEHTSKTIDKLLKEDNKSASYYYSSSW